MEHSEDLNVMFGIDDIREFSEEHNELLSYLEYEVLNNTATNSEITIYENYKWFHTFDIESDEYIEVINKMSGLYMDGYKG